MKKLIFWNEESSRLEVECREYNIKRYTVHVINVAAVA
jgi:hypothetical protein